MQLALPLLQCMSIGWFRLSRICTSAAEMTSSGMLSNGSLFPGIPNCCCQHFAHASPQVVPSPGLGRSPRTTRGLNCTHHELYVLALAPLQIRLGIIFKHQRPTISHLTCYDHTHKTVLSRNVSMKRKFFFIGNPHR